MAQAQLKNALTARVTEYEIPPIRDALVLGREAPIGCHAVRRALSLLVKAPFEHIELDDEVISDILIRENLLRRMPREQIIAFVLDHVKPLMAVDEVLRLDLEIEVNIAVGPT